MEKIVVAWSHGWLWAVIMIEFGQRSEFFYILSTALGDRIIGLERVFGSVDQVFVDITTKK